MKNPISGEEVFLDKSPSYKNNRNLQSKLARKNFFALRFGILKTPPKKEWGQWKVSQWKLKELTSRKLEASDINPNFTQKGVDMKMGLDIASMTSKKLCTKLVLITGDTDMIPAMKMARKDGVQVFLHTFRNLSNHDMAVHSDAIIHHREVFQNVEG